MMILTDEAGPTGNPQKNKCQPSSHTLHKTQFQRDGSNYDYTAVNVLENEMTQENMLKQNVTNTNHKGKD